MNAVPHAVTHPIPWEQLYQAALEARAVAYAPYSDFRVGAAIWCDDGTIYRGANIENASYGLTLCAERVAVSLLLMSGRQTFQAIAVATEGGITPCGACRQVLAEFARDVPVGLLDTRSPDKARVLNLAELLPFQFSKESLPS